VDRLSTGLNILWQFDDNQPHGYAVGAFLMEMDMTFKERDRWMRAVLADDQLTMGQRAIAVRIALFLRVETGELPFQWDCLQAALKCSRDTLATAMSQLEEFGWITVQRNGRYSPNVYVLSSPKNGLYAESEIRTPESVPQTRTESEIRTEVREAKEENLERESATTSQSFGEWDYLSSDRVLFIAAQEIKSWEPDYPRIKDLRAAIRQADRWAISESVQPAKRKSVLLTCLKRENDRLIEFDKTRAEKAAERKVEADRREARYATRGRQAVLP
jgi:hypothetical protein